MELKELKIKVFNNFNEFESNDMNEDQIIFIKLESQENKIHEINQKCKHKSTLIIQESLGDEKSTIYWKSADIEEFLIFKSIGRLKTEANRLLNEFIVNFLISSLKINHLGLISKLSIQPGIKPIRLDLLADPRDFNLLLLAAEHGNSVIVDILQQQGMNTKSLDNSTNAQNLAWNNQHFDVLCTLLQANIKFPESFEVNSTTGKCKEFCELTEEVHKLIKSNSNDKLKKILDQHKNLKHFYNFSNESALKIAITNGSYEVYKELTSRKFRYASHEDPAEYLEDLEFRGKKIVREIHDNFSDSIIDKHINALVGNSFIYHDDVDGQDKQDIISRAYKSLDSISLVRIILMIVAASKNFKIIFDFNHESVNVADPTQDSDTQGLFYVSGRVYIGAKQLLNPDTEDITLANMAHELCHFTMNFVYDNQAKPYKSDDQETEKEFQKITDICKQSDQKEDIVDVVFNAYRKKMHHAELIVRVVHLTVFYRNYPGKLEKVREIFNQLFEFYENKIVPELENALTEIVSKDEKILEIKDQKISKLKKISIAGGILAILGVIAAIVIGIIFYTPTYTFKELTPRQQKIISNSSVIYKNVKIHFHDLFLINSSAYEILSSDHITNMMHGKILNLNDPQVQYLGEAVSHSWTNLTGKLKSKFLTSNFTFQNESLNFKILHDLTPNAFDFLTSQQIIDVMDDKTLIISNMTKNEAKFTVERKIFDENLHEIYYEFMHLIEGNDRSCTCRCFNKTKITKTFDSFYEEFRNQSLDIQIKRLERIRKKETYTVCPIDKYEILAIKNPYPVADTLLSHTSLQYDFDEVVEVANDTKIFILSAEAGVGKTESFELLTMRTKKKYPTQWVSYIDLKDHKDLYSSVETLDDVLEMLEKIFGLNDANKFEELIFKELFKSGNVILLWNGFDEISPEFSEAVLKILSIIRNNTETIQFICTRPLYTEQLRDKFMTKTYTLIPFTAEEQENFVRKFLIANKVDESKIPNYILKVQSIVNFTQSKEGFDTPLLLGMIAELVSSDVEIYETENIYELYRKFVEKKVKIWQENSAFAKQFLNTLVTSGFSIKNLHQRYAMRHELQSGDYFYKFAYFNALKLKVMRQKVLKGLTNDEVSRMGILFINGPKTFKFAHRTFAEFFVAQYFIENIYFVDDEPTDEEVERRIRTFYHLFSYPFHRIRTFIRKFLLSKEANESHSFDRKISKVLRKNFQRLYFNSLIEFNEIPMLHFFMKDNKVLKNLLHINDDETIYTATYNAVYYPKSKYQLIWRNYYADFVKPYLSVDEFQCFKSDTNQKGIILFSSYCLHYKIKDSRTFGFIFHENYTLDDEFLMNLDAFLVFEAISKNLTKIELKTLLTSEVILNRNIFNDKLWKLIEENLQVKEQKSLLVKFLGTTTILINGYDLKFALKKLKQFFNNAEINEIFLSTNILNSAASFRTYTFQPLWNFFINHTNLEQQKLMLTRIVHNECFARPFKGDEQIRYCYVFPPLNMLQTSLFAFESLDAFEGISKIYETYFDKTEIQKIILSSTSDFLPVLIVQGDQYLCSETVNYLKRLFIGNEKLLKEFLIQEVEPTTLNVFELLRDFHDYNNCLNIFTKLFNEL